MRINRAYTDTGAMGKQRLANSVPAQKEGRSSRQVTSSSGDSLNLSSEALALLAQNDNNSMSSSPDDGTYDQFGNMTRHFDTVQQELRSIAAQLNGANPALQGKLAGVRNQLASIRAEV